MLGIPALALPSPVQGRGAGGLCIAPPPLRGRPGRAHHGVASRRAEHAHHLPCGLLGAIVQVESGGQPHRISAAGAMGPMQLIAPTARALQVSDPFSPEESVDGAARYLHAHLATFHNVRLAVAAYNAGPGAIVGRQVPQNGQTEIYVDRVMQALVAERRARCVPARPPDRGKHAPPISPPTHRRDAVSRP